MFGSAKYRDFDYMMVTHARVFSLSLKNGTLSREAGLYIACCINKHKQRFSYNSMASWNKLKNIKIALPVRGKQPDYDYMESYINDLETKHINKLNAYLADYS